MKEVSHIHDQFERYRQQCKPIILSIKHNLRFNLEENRRKQRAFDELFRCLCLDSTLDCHNNSYTNITNQALIAAIYEITKVKLNR